MFIIVYTSVDYGEVETVVESTGHKTYAEAQTKVRELMKGLLDEGEDQNNLSDTTDTSNACLYIDSCGEGQDAMYKILEV